VTGLLVSVRSVKEAIDAMHGGANLVDVKEPRHGSLGAASPQTWTAIVNQCRGRVPVSIALGELIDPDLSRRLTALPTAGFAKIGLAGCRHLRDWPSRWCRALERMPRETRSVAVTYADAPVVSAPDPREISRLARQLGCHAVLWDTGQKTKGNLLQHVPVGSLRHHVDQARQAGLIVVLAGSLTLDDLPRLQPLSPHFIAVRGAVCESGRNGVLSRQRVAQWADALSRWPAS